ncbi:MAG: hypothetical protein JXB62_19555 [Pirellulales bacterium]|nr:hypothetical protein [Pirellulales bacterium]
MPLELTQTIIVLAFLAVCLLSGEILVRQRKGKRGIPGRRRGAGLHG